MHARNQNRERILLPCFFTSIRPYASALLVLFFGSFLLSGLPFGPAALARGLAARLLSRAGTDAAKPPAFHAHSNPAGMRSGRSPTKSKGAFFSRANRKGSVVSSRKRAFLAMKIARIAVHDFLFQGRNMRYSCPIRRGRPALFSRGACAGMPWHP